MVLRKGVSVLKPLVRSTGLGKAPCRWYTRLISFSSNKEYHLIGVRVYESVLKPLVRLTRPGEAPVRWYMRFIYFSSDKEYL